MAKPDPALLNPARYPFICRIEPRFSDLDANLHINNVAMAGMLEDARVRFQRGNGYRGLLVGRISVVASIAIEYLAEASYPDPLEVACAIEHVGRTSHQVVQLVMQDSQPLAFARTVIAMVGPDGPSPLPENFVAAADAWMLSE